jgi:CheY-like chemotaxis protein
MAADAASLPPELPPGLLEDYLENTRAQLGVLADLADRLVAAGNDREALDTLRRETHKIHGSAGSYGFWDASRLAAGMEETVKDWAVRPDDRDVDRGSLARWFVVRLAETMKLDVPDTRRADRPSGPMLQAELLSVPEVIVVEDDAALAELLEYGLRSRGYRFAAFRNGREALDHLLTLETGDAHPLLLLDVDLPALDGYSIFAALQRERPGTYRVVFTTVHGDEGEQLRGLEAGALDYLVKPISLRVALEKIRRWVGR